MDREAVEQALAKNGPRILHLAFSYLRSREDAEDVLQETMFRYFQSAPPFEDDEHEKAWLLRVAANLCKNILRSPAHKSEELPEELPCEGIPEESIALYQAVAALPEKYREVVHLFYYEDLTTVQIAAVLEKRESSVRSLLHRARELLRKSYGADFETERGRAEIG